jgi:hypothetical protein
VEHEERLQKGDPAALAQLSPFWTRLESITLKLAMLMQVATCGTPTLSLDSMSRAIGLTEVFKSLMQRLFTKEIQFTDQMRRRAKVLRFVEQRGPAGISRRELLRGTSLLLADLKPILDTLLEERSVIFNGERFFFQPETPDVSPLSAVTH